MKNAKEEWIDEKCIDLDESVAANNIRLAFDVLKTHTRSKHSREVQIEDKSNEALQRGRNSYQGAEYEKVTRHQHNPAKLLKHEDAIGYQNANACGKPKPGKKSGHNNRRRTLCFIFRPLPLRRFILVKWLNVPQTIG